MRKVCAPGETVLPLVLVVLGLTPAIANVVGSEVCCWLSRTTAAATSTFVADTADEV